MRVAVAVTLALTLGCSAVAVAQQRDVKPSTDTAREPDRSSVGARSVTGTVKKTIDKGIVVVGRETGEKDREWAFALEAGTRPGGRHAPWRPARALKRAVRSEMRMICGRVIPSR
jgi:hypothetical protein